MKTIVSTLKTAAMIALITVVTMTSTKANKFSKQDSSVKHGKELMEGKIMGVEEEGPVTGIANDEQDKIRIYPVPASTLINVEMGNLIGDETLIDIYNVTGQKVMSGIKPNQSKGATINVEKLDDGIYFMSIRNKIRIINNKIVIKHR